MIKRVLKALSFIFISILCSIISCQKEPDTVAVTGITLSQTSVELTEGESTRITATISPSNATNKTVIWSSDNSYVTVSDGTITGAKPCTATVTAKSDDGGKTATCSVTVKSKVIQVTGVTLSKAELTLTEGDTQSLTATVSPENATDKSVTWSSDNTSVADVSSTGIVVAKAPGTATITVKTNDGGKTASCTVTVRAKTISVTGVSLDMTSLTMTEGETRSLVATVSPENATDKTVTWSSNNSSVATVSSSGVVTAKSPGTATITVKTNDGGKTATCSVTVKAKVISVTGVSLNTTTLTMTEGDSQTLTATVSPSNATDQSVTWTSSNTTVATVSSSGVVTAKSPGTATITVRTNDGGMTASCVVTVREKTISVSGVSLDNTNISMTKGDVHTLTATITPSNATDKSLSWSSSNESVAKVITEVSTMCIIQAESEGTAIITVKTNDGGKTATCAVTVKPIVIPVTGISLNTTSMTMKVGETKSLSATVTPSNATDKTVTWKSSDPDVATVSSDGLVSAKDAGTTIINVVTKDGGFNASCEVVVIIPVTGISLDKASVALFKGSSVTLVAKVNPSNASNTSIVWSSSNPAVASVSNGTVNAVSAGEATITATTVDGSYSAKCEIKVSESINGGSEGTGEENWN